MKRNRKSEALLVNELTAACRREGVCVTAQRLHFAVQFVSDVIHGRRPLSPRLAGAMGYRRIVEYEKEG